MPHRPKLLALDMDGTLLTSTKQIAAQTSEALAALCATGVTIALSTGRGPAELNDFAGRLPWASLGSLCSGGLVYDLRAGRPLASTPIPDAEALACIGAGGREGAMVHLSTTTRSVTQTGFIEHCEDYAVGVYKPMFRRQWDCSDDLTAYVADHPNAVIKIDIYHPDQVTDGLHALVRVAHGNGRPRHLECVEVVVIIADGHHVGTVDAQQPAQTHEAEGLVDAAGGALHRGGLRTLERKGRVRRELGERSLAGRGAVADNDHNGIVEAIEWLF